LVHKALGTTAFECAVAAVVLANVVVMAFESDLRADCVMSPEKCGSPGWLGALNVFFVVCYSLECALRLFVQRKAFLFEGWNYLDTLVVVLGFLQLGIGSGVQQVNMLRIVRIARFLRIVKILRWVPALWSMISGLVGAFQAMSWGLILVVVLLLVWSIIAVEVIHPIAWRVHTQPTAESEWCRTAFSSVPKATLYFFVTLVAGDGWAVCAVPIIEDSPMAWSVFAVSLVTIQLGFLNLVLAVIVDNAAEAREASKEEQARTQKTLQAQSFVQWVEVMKVLDVDNSGNISMEELMMGYEDPHVKEMLDDMRIGKSDLETLFKLMDVDDSGTLGYGEFISALMKAQMQDPKVYSMTMQLRLKKIEMQFQKRLDDHLIKMNEKLEACFGPAAAGHPAPAELASTKNGGDAATYVPKASAKVVAAQAPSDIASLAAELRNFALQISHRLEASEIRAAEAVSAQARVSLEVAASVLGALRGAPTAPATSDGKGVQPTPAMTALRPATSSEGKAALQLVPSTPQGEASPRRLLGRAGEAAQPPRMQGATAQPDAAMAVVEALGAAAATAQALLAELAASPHGLEWGRTQL